MKILAGILIILSFCSSLLPGQSGDSYKVGLDKLKKLSYQESIEYFNQVLRKNSKDIGILTLRGYAKAQMKDFKGAMEDFDLIIKLNPGNSDAYNRRGICKKGLGDYEGALEDFNRAIELDSLNRDAYSNRGVIKYKYFKDEKGASEDWIIAKNMGSPVATRLLRKYFFDPEGIMEMPKGTIVFANFPDLHFTLFLDDHPECNNYPLIRMEDGKVIEFYYTKKTQFAAGDKEAIEKYLKWETNNQNRLYHTQLNVRFERIYSPLKFPMKFWYYENLTPGKVTHVTIYNVPAVKTYYVTFIYGDFLFSISYPSVSGRDKDAGTFLMDLLNNITFYKNELNFDKLRKAIGKGKTSYKE